MKMGFEIIEERKDRRFSGRLGVIHVDEEGLNFGALKDLSRGGAYLEFQKPVALGSKFSFVLSNGGRQEHMSCQVTRLDASLFHNKPSCLGVRFCDLSHSAKRLRDDMLLYLMLQAHSPFHSISNPK